MQIKCPSCNAQFPLEAAVAFDAARSALNTALHMPAPLGGLIAQYLGLFRASGRALAFDRADRLMAELLPLLRDQQVTRNGLVRSCPLALWQQALERMLEHRAAGKLDLPLKSHGYLLEIALGLAEKAEAEAERNAEERRRTGTHRSEPKAPTALERHEQYLCLVNDARLGVIPPDDARERIRALGFQPPQTFD